MNNKPADTTGSLLADIALSLQDSLRMLMFADKRGWGSAEFQQIRALEEALDEAKRDFQAMAPLVNGQFYYESDRNIVSLSELRALRAHFAHHAETLKGWLRGGGPIDQALARYTHNLRRQLHRAQCRTARRIFNVEHDDGGGSGGRCLGAYLLYRRLRQQEDADQLAQAEARSSRSRQQQRCDAETGQDAQHSQDSRYRNHNHHSLHHLQRVSARASRIIIPAWKAQQPRLHAREERQFAGREPPNWGGGKGGNSFDHDEADAVEMTTGLPRPPAVRWETDDTTATATSTATTDTTTNATSTPVPTPTGTGTPPPTEDTPSSPPPPPPPFETTPSTASARPQHITLEHLVPDCNAIGTFQRFGEHDIAFICDFCDGHIVWEDVLRLPTTRSLPPPGATNDASSLSSSSSSYSSSNLPTTQPYLLRPVQSQLSSQLSSQQNLPQPLLLPQLQAQQRQEDLNQQQQQQQQHQQPPIPPPLLSDTWPNGYPRWQATTFSASQPDHERTVVFAPLAIANHLPPPGLDVDGLPGLRGSTIGGAAAWEARIWCPYCDDYQYYDSAEGDQTQYAQDENGCAGLAAFQEHLEWFHTALPAPTTLLPKSAKDSCAVM